MTDANVTKDPEEGRQPRPASPEKDDEEAFDDANYLDELPDGSGCTEIWEYLSGRRDEDEHDGEG